MTLGLVGRKCGMTRVFTENGESIPVTVVEVIPNRVVQLKSPNTDGYSAVQVTTGKANLSKLKKPVAGHYAKAGVEPGSGLWEFRLTEQELGEIQLAQEITVSVFSAGQKVDVTGITKGRGFAGTIKRWNFSGQRNSHGNSLSHRVPGSIGQNQTPGRVFKGKKMSGHLGCDTNTIQNLEVVKVDPERNLVLIKGAIPGAPGGNLMIRPAVKAKTKKEQGAA
ncbi:MAG: 50S ribosomal protein L3 [Gammaproteobacteria bacterium]